MKEYTIKEFVEGYKKCTTDLLKERYIKERLVLKTQYVPYLLKIELCKNIIEHFCMNENKDYIYLNTPIKNMFITKTFIQQYTNLISETAGFYDEYDLLIESGLIGVVLTIIPQDEFEQFNEILECVENDIIFNFNENHVFVDRQITRIKNLIENISSPLFDKLSEKIDNLSEKDLQKIGKYIDKILK